MTPNFIPEIVKKTKIMSVFHPVFSHTGAIIKTITEFFIFAWHSFTLKDEIRDDSSHRQAIDT